MPKQRYPFEDPDVKAKFAAFPLAERQGLLGLRKLIFDVATKTPEAGVVHEMLKWSQPAYLTPDTKSGSTIRLGLPKKGGFAVFVHCQTSIISDFQILFPDDFDYEGNRAIHFLVGEDLPFDKLEILVRRALTYHL